MKGQKKIKAKKLRNHAPNSAKAYSWMKYDRNFVHDQMADVSTLPMSRGSKRKGLYTFAYEHPNRRLYRYLDRFMEKQVGRKLSDVFRDFKRLGWKSTYEMYFYWDSYVSTNIDICYWYHYFESEDGTFTRVA